MSTLHTYLPQDRLRALVRGETLPDRTTGAALFADISGFTTLTEALRTSLGPRQGAEELTKHLDAVYTALITEVEKYGGSVLGFAGDAITCWFDANDDGQSGQADNNPTFTHNPSALAVSCAFALQAVMSAFPQLALKVAVTSGPARRFVVGNPAIHYLDALAGATVARTATAEHLAQRGEIVLDAATVQALGDALTIREWRSAAESDERFAVANQLLVSRNLSSPTTSITPSLSILDLLQPFILPAVYAREFSGQGAFLTEFRFCTVMFVRFVGIDYESDDAQAHLDLFIRQLQRITTRYDGAVLQLTIGDKGSYIYVNFGALSAHEDDARRAVKAALELKNTSSLQLQIGLTQGVMRVGAYGGATRRTYGALGDDVNLAARLMQTATVGEILLSESIQKATAHEFLFETRPALMLKGKTTPVTAFAVLGEQQKRALRLQEPQYALPMVGRTHELQLCYDQLERVLAGKGQVIGIVAEAGLGKSRLVAEVIRRARQHGFAGYGGACQSDAINTPYQAWKSIWPAFFGIDSELPLAQQIQQLATELTRYVPARAAALPLLGILLNLEIPENDFTKTLEPQYRQSALQAVLEECLRAAAKDEPLLIVVEDLHWIDALSHDLLENLARALTDVPVCFVLAYRPPQLERLQSQRLEALPNFTRIVLQELNPAEAVEAIHTKLAQLYPDRQEAVPAPLVAKLIARAQGNPFFLEELLNFLHDRQLDPRDPGVLDKIELPDNLHALILSRIDQLSEHEKTTLRVASIIGRLFRAAWLTGYYPDLGSLPRVHTNLSQLAELEITPLDVLEPELAYLFKHIITHEVTYESLPFATRARLHEQLAQYLEKQIAAGALAEAFLLDMLVYHYARSENRAKEREYLRKAGQAALNVSAFTTAVTYLTRLVELTPPDDPTRSALMLHLAEAHYSLSDFPTARAVIQQTQAAASTDTDRAAALALLGEIMSEGLGDYAAAQTILTEAVPLARTSGDPLTLCRALYALGNVGWRLGQLNEARVAVNESLALARALGDVNRELFALNRLGVIAIQQDLSEAAQLLHEVHQRAAAAGNRERAMTAFNNLGRVAYAQRDIPAARAYYQQALVLAREVGAQQVIALCLLNLADVDIQLGQLSAARTGLHEGLVLALRLGALPRVVSAVKNFAYLAHAEGQTERALALLGLATRQPAWSSDLQRHWVATRAQWALDPIQIEAGLAKGTELDWNETLQGLLRQ